MGLTAKQLAGLTTLGEITKILGKTHGQKKVASKDLDLLRKKFFDAATEDIGEEQLARKTIPMPSGESDDGIENHLAKWHPGWRYVETKGKKIVIEEDPAYVKYVFYNPVDGQIYQRNVVPAGTSLDDDLLREEDPDLWERVTCCPFKDILYEFVDFAGGDVVKPLLEKYLATFSAFERELIPLEELPDEDLDALTKYLVPGPLTLRLESPRKAKPEEIDEDDD